MPYSLAFFSRRTVIWVSSLLVLTACSSQPTATPSQSPEDAEQPVAVIADEAVEPSPVQQVVTQVIEKVLGASVAATPSPEKPVTVVSSKAEVIAAKPAEAESSVAEVVKTQAATVESPAIAVAEKVAEPSVSKTISPKDSVAVWLGEAGWAFEQDKLTTPKSESAYHYLTKVLTKEPGNPQALIALEKIVQRYYELLQVSLNKGKVKQARVFLSRAGTVVPKHHQLEAMGALIDNYVPKPSAVVAVVMAETAEPAMRKQKLLLPADLVKQQDELLAQWLVGVAKKAHQLQATMLIVAPTDAQARWIYQTMNSADPDQRIRANIKRSKPSRIEVSYLARKDQLEVYPN